VAVDYPADICCDTLYPGSVSDGITDTISKIHDYVATCGAASRIVLIGYSQGGNVMTNVLAGGVAKPDPLGEEYRQNSECCYHYSRASSLRNHSCRRRRLR
jgi:hypothetical protein